MTNIGLPKPRKLTFYRQFTQETLDTLAQKIFEIEQDDLHIKKALKNMYNAEYVPDPIEIYIDSYGGNVHHGFGLISLIDKCQTPVHTFAVGAAMSCGFLLLISGKRRFAYEHSYCMYHQLSTGVQGKLKDVIQRVEHSKELQRVIEKITLTKTKLSKEELKRFLDEKEDVFYSAKEALKHGIVDEII